MKIKCFSYFQIIVFTAGILILFSCASTKKIADCFVGKWGYSIDTPQENNKGHMEISHEGICCKGLLNSEMGSVDLNGLIIKDGQLTANFDRMGNSINISVDFKGKVFNGTAEAGGYRKPFKATKINE